MINYMFFKEEVSWEQIYKFITRNCRARVDAIDNTENDIGKRISAIVFFNGFVWKIEHYKSKSQDNHFYDTLHKHFNDTNVSSSIFLIRSIGNVPPQVSSRILSQLGGGYLIAPTFSTVVKPARGLYSPNIQKTSFFSA